MEMDKKEKFANNLPFEEAVKRQYKMCRTIDEYSEKFPTLLENLKTGLKILEIGAGDGIAFNEIVNKYGLVGSATNIEEFKDKTFVQAVASNLPFKDNSFDLVIGIHSITWEPNQKKSIEEVFRVLKDGGKGFINLYKFSEISELWFGNGFWNHETKNEYRKKFEFEESIFPNYQLGLRKERAIDNHEILSYNYFITILK